MTHAKDLPKPRNTDGAYASGPVAPNVAGTSDGTYSANEQTELNDLVTAVNAILAALRANGTIAS